MIDKLKAWYRAHRLAAAKRVLVEHYNAAADAQGFYSGAQRHKYLCLSMLSIADDEVRAEAMRVGTSPAHVERIVARAKPGAFVPIETGGRPIPKPEAWWIENRPAPRPWPSNTAREADRIAEAKRDIKVRAAELGVLSDVPSPDEKRAQDDVYATGRAPKGDHSL